MKPVYDVLIYGGRWEKSLSCYQTLNKAKAAIARAGGDGYLRKRLPIPGSSFYAKTAKLPKRPVRLQT